MPRFRKVYLEISNICNLNCSFCPGTKRIPHIMGEDNFRNIIAKLRPWTDFLYFHLMGEPLCHPNLERYLELAGNAGFKVIITTNGTLLSRARTILLDAPALHKVNISLHSFEANVNQTDFDRYLADCFSFGKATDGQKLVVYRLWNNGGANDNNQYILQKMHEAFADTWIVEPRGTRISNRVYLEYGDKFDWPDLTAQDHGTKVFCYGLKDQIGVLCDGTVVPCCLDHEGDIALGNLLYDDLGTILESDRAIKIGDGFMHNIAHEELCRKCGYARRFQ